MLSLLLLAVVVWNKRSAIGDALDAAMEPFRVPPGVRIDAEMLGVQIPDLQEDWSVYDAPAFARLGGRKTAS